MIVFSDNKENNAQSWEVALVMTPDQNLYLIMVCCAIILFIISIAIIVLHVEERSEDQKNKPKIPDF